MPRNHDRYKQMTYCFEFGDDEWKAEALRGLIRRIPHLDKINVYVDIGCGNGGTCCAVYRNMVEDGIPVRRAIGYDIACAWESRSADTAGIEFRQEDYCRNGIDADLATLNDVVEHTTRPQVILEAVAKRCRYAILHIPLDDRLSVFLPNAINYRLDAVGHISFWNVSSALNLLTASGLTPLHCYYTPGFLAPSGRKRVVQRLALPVRALVYKVSPWLASKTIGGVSLAVLCEGERAE